jgi:signal transduction histidine kinase
VTETLLRRSAGDVFWARTSAWIVDDEEGGEPIVEGFVEDVTEHKLSVEALRESEERLRSVVSAMAEGMLLLDPEGTLLAANAAAEALLGLEVDPYSGGLRFPVDLEVVGRGDAPLLREERPAFLTLRTGEPQIGHLLGIRRGVGAPLSWLSVNSQPLRRHGESEPYAAVVTFHDLTAWMRAEEERDRLREQLLHAQKMESVGRLAGGVAHDFNNMLGVILGRTELALESVTSDDPLRENLVEIQQAAQRSADLTSQLLAFARKQFVAPRLLDLNETVAGTLKMLRRLIGEDIEVRWQPSLEPMPVWIDPTQVDQILANLAVNARDAIDGVGMITIGIRTARLDPDDAETHTVAPGDYVVLAVSDTGHGIDSQTLDHLFEPFFTTKAHGKGTGLGLATVYGIVMQNQGFVEVESAAGRETTFRVWLPRATEEREAQAPGPRPPREVRGSETVMLVEDEPAVLRFAATVLRRQGYTVLTAPGPIEALLAAEMHPGRIDLLVTDVIMPLMDGKELADRLQASVPSLRCLFTSGYTADVIVPRGVVDDGVSFLQKPFLPAALAESVRAVLDA